MMASIGVSLRRRHADVTLSRPQSMRGYGGQTGFRGQRRGVPSHHESLMVGVGPPSLARVRGPVLAQGLVHGVRVVPHAQAQPGGRERGFVYPKIAVGLLQ